MDASSISDLVEHYAIVINKTRISTQMFVILCVILAALFMMRGIAWLNVSNTTEKIRKKFAIYVVGHITLEWIVAIIISMMIVILTQADPTNIFANYIIAPGVGFLLSILIDNELMKKFENSDGFLSNPTHSKESSKPESNINVVINNTTSEEEENETPSDLNLHYITDDEIEKSDDTTRLFKDSINAVIKNQEMIVTENRTQNEQLKEQMSILMAMQESLMTDKKFKLKQMIYVCLDQGYATPDQNERITADYHTYTGMGGNGDVKELYENHYLKLPIHNDYNNIEEMGPDPARYVGNRKFSTLSGYNEFTKR